MITLFKWFFRNWKWTFPLKLIAIALYFREFFHPFFFQLREYWMFSLLLALSLILLIVLMVWNFKRSAVAGRVTTFALGIGLVASAIFFRADNLILDWFDYAEKRYAYQNELNIVELSEIPLTRNERLYPLNLLKQRIANEQLPAARELSEPDEVRIDEHQFWSTAVQPAKGSLQRWYKNIEEVRFVDVQATSLKPKAENIKKVNFDVGETMIGSRNTFTAIIRGFSPFKYFNYKPAEVKFMPNDEGEMVQVITLIRMKGGLYAHPTFGGVYIIKQYDDSLGLGAKIGRYLKRVFLGDGKFISPEEIASGQHEFLTRQNLRPYEQSRYLAESFRFKGGLSTVITHENDIKIPDLDQDLNPLPHVSDNDFRGTGVNIPPMMTHFIPIEPYDKEKNALLYSLYIPADGITDKVYVVNHRELGHDYFGISEVSTKIFDSRKEITQDDYHAIEHIDCNRDVMMPDGTIKRKKFWFSTVVTVDKRNTEQTVYNSSVPDKTLTDAEIGTVKWVPQDELEYWDSSIKGLIRYDEGGNAIIEKFDDNLSAEIDTTELTNQIDSLKQIETTLTGSESQAEVDSLILMEQQIEAEIKKQEELLKQGQRQQKLEERQRYLDSLKAVNKSLIGG